ncbi:MAG: hypothetical protein ALECFALPRED_008988 [Alectoria fallacina]|uniref:Uncharacterized protein n=1 Tax=Alectoria fallacina TaxID=1903189 RepID=A0A8H3J5G2_9LECA|nr:MAG: hypothetical protein ALECFALPRED_008988 [Alectoria fallacina]
MAAWHHENNRVSQIHKYQRVKEAGQIHRQTMSSSLLSDRKHFARGFAKARQLRKTSETSLSSVNAMACNMEDKSSDMEITPKKSSYNKGDEASGNEAAYVPEATLVTSGTGNTSSDSKASHTPRYTTIAANAPTAADPEGPVTTYEFVWHYDHNPVFVPREITQSHWESDWKEFVQFYTKTDSSDKTDNDNTYLPTHRAEVRLFRNNEKRVTFDCRFQENDEVLTDVRFVKSESINMDGMRWPFFEDSRGLEELDLRLRDERDENGHYYIEFIVRQKSHRDSSDMPHLTVLGRKVVDHGPLEFSEEEALRLVRRKTPEPYEIEETPAMDGATEADEISDIEEASETEDYPETGDYPETEGWWDRVPI